MTSLGWLLSPVLETSCVMPTWPDSDCCPFSRLTCATAGAATASTIASVATNSIVFLNFFYLLEQGDSGRARYSFIGNFPRQCLKPGPLLLFSKILNTFGVFGPSCESTKAVGERARDARRPRPDLPRRPHALPNAQRERDGIVDDLLRTSGLPEVSVEKPGTSAE